MGDGLCFWVGFISAIRCDDFQYIFKYTSGLKPRPHEFVQLLKDYNIITTNVLWNNNELIKNQLDENFTAINELDINSINTGYLCSIFDPFVFLICELLQITIEHNYNGYLMTYKHKINNKYTLKFKNDIGHFSVC
jgi:hypothetical protein